MRGAVMDGAGDVGSDGVPDARLIESTDACGNVPGDLRAR